MPPPPPIPVIEVSFVITELNVKSTGLWYPEDIENRPPDPVAVFVSKVVFLQFILIEPVDKAELKSK